MRQGTCQSPMEDSQLAGGQDASSPGCWQGDCSHPALPPIGEGWALRPPGPGVSRVPGPLSTVLGPGQDWLWAWRHSPRC